MQTAFFSQPASAFCARCGRHLSNHVSVQAGKGPVCRGKQKLSAPEAEKMEDTTLFDPIQKGIILRRGPTGLATNIPHHCVHHSPTGFEWGYAGSGPADLAINAVESILLAIGYTGERVSVWRGECFDVAFRLHQDFKRKFIAVASADAPEVVIPWKDVSAWVEGRVNQIKAKESIPD